MSEEDEPDNVWKRRGSARPSNAPTLVDAPEKRCAKCGRSYAMVAEFCTADGTPLVAARRAPNDPFIGATIHDRYAIEGVLGSGGMATVYEAIHTGLHKRFALKILRPDIAFDKVTVERFIQEARIAASLKHQNLVEVSDFGEVSADDVPSVAGRRVPFFVMELLRGDTLRELIRGRGRLDEALATEILRQAASGLAVAHEAGVIHRDLKPENVFVTDASNQPLVKVLDFGIAKVAASARKLTRPNVVFGTPVYMSPEQSRGEAVDARTDLFSLGVAMFEAITGEVPVVEEGVVPDDTELGALAPVVMRCIERDPGARFQSATEIVRALTLSSAKPPRIA
jgi:serine/threonine protein kinase